MNGNRATDLVTDSSRNALGKITSVSPHPRKSGASNDFPEIFSCLFHPAPFPGVLWSQMSKRLTSFCILSLILGATADGNAASTLKMTCSGNLTNTRSYGVTLGQCDLNFISVKQMDEIETICGLPGTVDTPAENQCRIRAVVSPDPISAADKRKLYKVIELWSVDKR